MTTDKQKLHAVVELFGHARVAGEISEHSMGSTSFVRVDVPQVIVKESTYESGERVERTRLIESHTRLLGGAAIYSINLCDADAALVAAYEIRHEPMRAYSLREAIQNLTDADRHRLLTAHRGVASRDLDFTEGGAPD